MTPIELDKMRNFKYGMRAISLIEKKLKKPISILDTDAMTMDEIAVMMWAGLVHEDKELTPDKVIDLVDEYSSFGAVWKLANEAMASDLGVPEADVEQKNE